MIHEVVPLWNIVVTIWFDGERKKKIFPLPTAVMDAAPGSPSTEEGTQALLLTWITLNPFNLEKGGTPGSISLWIKRVLFAYLNGAVSYAELQLIVLAF